MRLVELPTKRPITIDLDKVVQISMKKGHRTDGARKCRIKNGKPKIKLVSDWSIWFKPYVRIIFLGGHDFTIECGSNDAANEIYYDLQYLWSTQKENGVITPKEFFDEERD